MESMFFNARKFNQDIGNWNVVQVTDMNYAFAKLKELAFYETLSDNNRVDSAALSMQELPPIEKEEVMESCVYWTGSRPINENKGVVNLVNNIETETLIATVQSTGEGDSKVIIEVYNIDNIKIAESTVFIKNYGRENL